MNTRIILSAAAILLSANLAHANLVTNGDFSAGNMGFSSDYIYIDPSVYRNCWDPGIYTIAMSSDPCHPLWTRNGDHTSGDGRFMLVNGRTDAVSTIYLATFAVARHTLYAFQAWLLNLCCTDLSRPGAELSFYANGALLGSGGIGMPGVWMDISNVWDSGDADTVALEARNSTTSYDGNDFGLDDISLTPMPVPEPTSLILLGTGLVGVARGIRRRHRSR